ncbi:hypothetical protein BDR26DRAFT_936782 [Obelidium mucronatum]|nr:hypothetical protein BDR26DRAFT_936782 [Obelidium mucronatum]
MYNRIAYIPPAINNRYHSAIQAQIKRFQPPPPIDSSDSEYYRNIASNIDSTDHDGDDDDDSDGLDEYLELHSRERPYHESLMEEMTIVAAHKQADGTWLPSITPDSPPILAPVRLSADGKVLGKFQRAFLEANGWSHSDGTIKNGWKYDEEADAWQRFCAACKTTNTNDVSFLNLCKQSHDGNIHWVHGPPSRCSTFGKCLPCSQNAPGSSSTSVAPNGSGPSSSTPALKFAGGIAPAHAQQASQPTSRPTRAARQPNQSQRKRSRANDGDAEDFSDADEDAAGPPSRRRRPADSADSSQAPSVPRGRKLHQPSFGSHLAAATGQASPPDTPVRREFTAADKQLFFPNTRNAWSNNFWQLDLPDAFAGIITITGLQGYQQQFEHGQVLKRMRDRIDEKVTGTFIADRPFLYAHALFTRGFPQLEPFINSLADNFMTVMDINQRQIVRANCVSVILAYWKPKPSKDPQKAANGFGTAIRCWVDYMDHMPGIIRQIRLKEASAPPDLYEDHKYLMKGKYVTLVMEAFASDFKRNRSGKQTTELGDKWGALKAMHLHLCLIAKLSNCFVTQDEAETIIGCEDKREHDSHVAIETSATKSSVRRKDMMDRDIHDNFERQILQHTTEDYEIRSRCYFLGRLLKKGNNQHPGAARDLCMHNLSHVSCGRGSELRSLNLIRLLSEPYEIRTNADGYMAETVMATKILVDGTKLASLLAEKGKNDKRYIIVAPHFDPLRDFEFSVGFMEYFEQHVQNRPEKARELQKGYSVIKNIKLFTAASVKSEMSSSAHSEAVKNMHLALGVAIMNKCLHIFRKIQPKKMSEAGVPTEPIERIGWLTGDNKNTKSAFHTAYFKEYPREVVQYSTGMWPHGNQDGEFIAPRFRAPEPSEALLSHFFPLWRVFEDKVKNPDDPIFRETVDEVEDHNEAIGLMDLDSDEELTAEVLEANAHHLKSGVVSLPALGRTLAHIRKSFLYGLASLFYHIAKCPIVSAAVTPDIVEAIKAGGGGVFDTDEWKDFYQNVFVEEEKYAAWKQQMSTAKRPNRHTATSPTATVVRLSDEQVASLQLGRLPQNLQDEISGLPDIIRQALEAALLPYKDQLHENTRALERVMATLISSDMDRNAPPADRAQSNLIANDDTQNNPRDAPQVEEPPPAAIPPKAEGLCATYARPYSPSDRGKDNVPTVTFPVISSVGLAQVILFSSAGYLLKYNRPHKFFSGLVFVFAVLGSRHGTAIFGNTAKQKQFMNYNRVGWFVLDKAQLTLEQYDALDADSRNAKLQTAFAELMLDPRFLKTDRLTKADVFSISAMSRVTNFPSALPVSMKLLK